MHAFEKWSVCRQTQEEFTFLSYFLYQFSSLFFYFSSSSLLPYTELSRWILCHPIRQSIILYLFRLKFCLFVFIFHSIFNMKICKRKNCSFTECEIKEENDVWIEWMCDMCCYESKYKDIGGWLMLKHCDSIQRWKLFADCISYVCFSLFYSLPLPYDIKWRWHVDGHTNIRQRTSYDMMCKTQNEPFFCFFFLSIFFISFRAVDTKQGSTTDWWQEKRTAHPFQYRMIC